MYSKNILTHGEEPYRDDFQDHVEGLDNNYVKILFRPGRSVQARELTQMQTVLQSQINKFGKSIYKEGTAVIDGQCTIDNGLTWFKPTSIKFESGLSLSKDLLTTLATLNIQITQTDGINGAGTVQAIANLLGVSNDGTVLYIKFSQGSTFTNTTNWSIRMLYVSNSNNVVVNIIPPSSGAATEYIRTASQINVNRGVYFVAGSFVENTPQSVFVHHEYSTSQSPVNNLMTGYVAFNVLQTVVDYNVDTFLLDNSANTNNFNAPGADRHKIALNLSFKSTADWITLSESTNNYIQLLTVTNGKVFIAQRTEYSKLDDLLAQRTYEESGNYTVRPFVLDIREQSKALDPARGTVEANDANAKLNFLVGIEPAVAYVNGYRVELLERKDLPVIKKGASGIDVKSATATFTANYGSYIIGTLGGSVSLTNTGGTIGAATLTFTSGANNVWSASSIISGIGIPTGTTVGASTSTTTSVTLNANLNSNWVNGNTVTVRLFDNTLPDISNRTALYALLSDSDTVTPPSDSVPVTVGNLIGTCRVTSVESTNDNTTVRVFISDIQLAKSFGQYRPMGLAKYLKLLNSAGTAVDTAAATRFTLSNPAGFVQYDSDLSKLVFPLPYTAVKTLRTGDGASAMSFTYSARNRFTATTTVANQLVINTTGNAFTSNTPADYVVYNTTTAVYVSQFISTVTLSNVNQTATIVFTQGVSASNASNSLTVITHVQITDSTSNINRSKTRTTTGQTNFGVISGTTNPTWFKASGSSSATRLVLANSDIIKITSIQQFTTTESATGTFLDISKFQLDNGQRDTYYDLGAITYIAAPTETASVPYNIIVKYEYFTHDTVTGGYFTADSYGSDAADLITSYQGIKLSDCVDFRRSTLAQSSAASMQLEPNSAITTAIQFYMPRIDLVVVNKNSEFSVITGNPSLTPEAPVVPVHSLALYSLSIPGNLVHVKDIRATLIDNQRYTMRDIGELETRISNLEYYTSLSLLETQTNQKSILNSFTGTARFKNGFFADGFIGSNMGNVTFPGYLCSIDHQNQILRPFFTMTNSNLIAPLEAAFNTGQASANLNLHANGIMTLRYTNSTLIDQPYASSSVNVNPYNVFTWDGVVELSPGSDDWLDTVRQPDILVNNTGLYDAAASVLTAEGRLGTVWNSWASSFWTVTSSDFNVSRNSGEWLKQDLVAAKASRSGSVKTLEFTDIITGTAVDNVATSIIPFIRSREVYFKASLLKPNTLMYAFFDNVNISTYTRKKLIFTRFASSTSGVALYTDVDTNSVTVNDATSPTELTTDNSGNIIGSFIIPNTATLRFKTGDRVFKLCDSSTNTSGDITTFAQATYSVSGSLVKVQNRITSTRSSTGKILTSQVNEVGTNISKITYSDPLAQTFLIGDIATGCFITKIGLFFETVDTTIPVALHIVTCENGTPTQNILPGSKVKVISTTNNASINATLETAFTFDSPLYLSAGVEYAMVIMSMSMKYKVWIAEIGKPDISALQASTSRTIAISPNPYAGVFFMSQNASTWTADQTKDLKFKIYRAAFVIPPTTNSYNTAEFQSRNGFVIITTTTSNQLSTGLTTFTVASFTPAITIPVGTPITGPQLSPGTVITVALTGGTSYTSITVNSPIISGAAGTYSIYSSATETATLLNLSSQELVFPGTALDWSLNFNTNAAVAPIKSNQNFRLSSKRSFTNNSPSAYAICTATFNTVSNYISPVLDLDRLSLKKIQNYINNKNYGTDTTNRGLNDTGLAAALARYVTPEITLNNPADQLNIYMSISLPNNSDVQVYAKLRTNIPDIKETAWQRVNLISGTTIPVTDDQEEFNDVHFAILDTSDSVTTTVSAERFSSFMVKIEMLADETKTALTPLIKDLRIIATT